MKTLLRIGLLLLMALALPAEGSVTFNDGRTHYLSTPIFGDVFVYGSTTVNLMPGFQTLNEGSLRYYENSSGTMFGGFVAGSVMIWGNASFTLAGGAIFNGLNSFDNATILMEGGDIWSIGNNSGWIGLTGGNVRGNISSNSLNTVEIYGTDFAIDGEPIGSTTIGPTSSGFLTGTLETGDLLANSFYTTIWGNIIINDLSPASEPEPEPETLPEPPETLSVVSVPAPAAVLLGSLGVCLVGWLRRRKSLM